MTTQTTRHLFNTTTDGLLLVGAALQAIGCLAWLLM
jgi:hypothetical protein